ncbi:MAG: hypothetical protein ACK55I_18250, partial [bacterium]
AVADRERPAWCIARLAEDHDGATFRSHEVQQTAGCGAAEPGDHVGGVQELQRAAAVGTRLKQDVGLLAVSEQQLAGAVFAHEHRSNFGARVVLHDHEPAARARADRRSRLAARAEHLQHATGLLGRGADDGLVVGVGEGDLREARRGVERCAALAIGRIGLDTSALGGRVQAADHAALCVPHDEV